MRLRVEREPFADAVAWIARSIAHRPSVPVLAGAMLRVHDGYLHLSGFDFEVCNQIAVQVHAAADGAALVSGRLLAEIAKALPAKPVDITAVGSYLELTCGSARFTLPTMPVEDYPVLPQAPPAAGSVPATELATAVGQVAVAAGRDERLPVMSGIRVELTGTTMTLLATDRYRLAIKDLTWSPKFPGADTEVLVPARPLLDAAKALGSAGGQITLAHSDGLAGAGLIGFTGEGRSTTCVLLDGQYPPVRNLFAATFAAQATVDVPGLAEVVKRVSLVADKATPVRLSFTGQRLIVEAGGTEAARASEQMPAVFSGDPLTIAFNPQYLLDGLGALHAPTAVFSFNDRHKPAVITGADDEGAVIAGFRYLLMPIRTGR